MTHYLFKYFRIVNFGLIFICAVAGQDLSADTFRSPAIPDAIAQTSRACNEFTFDATQSTVPVSSDITYFWSFGDGSTGMDPVVTHTYYRSGDYMVNLTVTDNSGFECSSATTSKLVRANIPPRALLVSDDSACVNEPMVFDATTSYAEDSKRLRFSWDFGDGDTREGGAYHTKSYNRGGDYTARLTVDDQSMTACSTDTATKKIRINAPPIADAGNDTILRCGNSPDDRTVHFDASATKDINQDPLEYFWDFGDGYSAHGMEVSHQYDDPGQYDVRLIVSDNTTPACGIGVDFVTVKIGQPMRAHAGDDLAACVGQEIEFDGSNSFMETRGTAAAQWMFGDGASAAGLYATHRYKSPGTYLATLTLENQLNSRCPAAYDTRKITVSTPPSVSIQINGSTCVGDQISLRASSPADPNGDAFDYFWNFGDGTTFQGNARATHRYEQGGYYRVSVVVDDKKGSSCSAAASAKDIRINTPPIADAGTNLSCCVGQEAVFSAKASSDLDGELLIYTWDFGDGTKAQTDTVRHAYAQPGSYNVFLTVDDRSGTACSQSTDGFVAVAKEVPTAKINIR